MIGRTVDPLDEVSGITSSPSGVPVLWAHNDSGDKARLFALSSIDGAIVGEVQLTGAAAIDWEDITAYRAADGTPTLIVADTGDNNAVRPEVHLYLLPEPDPVTTKRAKAARVTLRFDEGPHDVEAIAVDVEAGELLIVGKRFGSSRTVAVHVVALADLAAGATLVPRTVGPWTVPIGELYGPTGADVSDDGQVLAVRLPFGIVTWNRRPGTSFARLLVEGVSPDCRLSLGSGQLESVTFLPDGRMVTVSEGVESELVVSERS